MDKRTCKESDAPFDRSLHQHKPSIFAHASVLRTRKSIQALVILALFLRSALYRRRGALRSSDRLVGSLSRESIELVQGEELLESEQLKRKLSEAKKRIESEGA